MRLTIIDYAGRRKRADIGSKEDIATIDIVVLSGDEIADVTYKDYTRKRFDSCDDRISDFFDDAYEIYHFRKKNNLIDNPLWLKRSSSYDDRWRNEHETD